MEPTSERFFEFGSFRLDLEGRALLDVHDNVVDLTPKAVEILCILVENRGRIVSKEELVRRVWPEAFVEEANLTHHVSRLRKALGETEAHEFIETFQKRGYRFVGKPNAPTPVALPRERAAGPGFGLLTATVAVLAIAGIAATVIWISRPDSSADAKTIEQRSNSSPPMEIVRVTNSGPVGASSISPDGKFIAYIQNDFDGEGMLFVRQTDTNAELKLLPPGARIFGGTAFSPDGRFIYYVVYDPVDPKGALYRIPVLGGAPSRLLNGFGSWFAIAPDGTRACFYRRDENAHEQRLNIAMLDGSGEETLLVRPEAEGDFSGFPAWSADGKSIAFAANTKREADAAYDVKLFEVKIDTRELRPLTDEVWSEIGKMSWLSDGSGIAFCGTRARSGIQVYLLSYPSGKVRRITNELNTYGNYGMGVTADGTALVADVWESSAQLWNVTANGDARNAIQLTTGVSDGSTGLAALPDDGIVYSSRTGFDNDLWEVRTENGMREGRPITNDDFFEGDVATTLDGHYLVFASDRAGGQHLFRSERSGANLRQLTFGDSSEARPDISSDGSWIVYASFKNNEARIFKLPIDGGEPIQLTDHESVAPSISPDGKFVSCVAPSHSPAQAAVLEVLEFETGRIVKQFDVIPFDFNYRPAIWTPAGDTLVYRKAERNVGNLWKQSLAGGEPRPFTNFTSELIFGYVFSTDGKSLIVSRGKRTVNVVMVRNFR